MHSVLLVSSDQELANKLRHVIGSDDRFVHWRSDSGLPYAVSSSEQWVVVDCRAHRPDQIVGTLAALRARVGERARYAALVTDLDSAGIEVVATIGGLATEILLAYTDSVADLLRAMLNDPTQTVAAAIALSALLEYLPEPTHEIVGCVLATGLQASSVKEVAAALRSDRSEIGRGLRESVGWTAKELVDLAKASFAAVLLRASALPVASVAEAARFEETRWLNALLVRTFELTATAIRVDDDTAEPGVWLERRLARL
jgi:hypothetical protein